MNDDEPPPDKRQPKGEYDVGYAKPPEHTRFKPGAKSANPKGRPKGSSKVDPFTKTMNRKIRITEGGKKRTVTIEEALAIKNIDRALKDTDPKAFYEIMRIRALFAKNERERPPTREEVIADLQREEERRQVGERFRELLKRMTEPYGDLKVLGVLEPEGQTFVIADWVIEAARQRNTDPSSARRIEAIATSRSATRKDQP